MLRQARQDMITLSIWGDRLCPTIDFALPKIFRDYVPAVRFASFLFGGFTTMAVINPPERKRTKRTSVQCTFQH